jgi:hypothetical protein
MSICLASDDADRRYYAAASLLWQDRLPAAIREKIHQQLETETDDRIRAVFQKLTESRGYENEIL